MNPVGYLSAFGTIQYWSLQNYALLAHLADISAILLIVTSNSLSKRIMGTAWKKVQRLSYVFFYASSLFVFLSYGDLGPVMSIVIVTIVTVAAYIRNSKRRATIQQPNPQTI
jgi:DMSO/TMAO reductase YedYZ heme-binding membrane subunit